MYKPLAHTSLSHLVGKVGEEVLQLQIGEPLPHPLPPLTLRNDVVHPVVEAAVTTGTAVGSAAATSRRAVRASYDVCWALALRPTFFFFFFLGDALPLVDT